jgi:hypothetical protein
MRKFLPSAIPIGHKTGESEKQQGAENAVEHPDPRHGDGCSVNRKQQTSHASDQS